MHEEHADSNVEDSEMNDFDTAKKNFSRIGWSYFVFVISFYALAYGISILLYKIDPAISENETVNMITGTFPIYFCVIFLYLMLRKVPKTLVPEKNLPFYKVILSIFVCQFMAYAGNLMSVVMQQVIASLTGFEPENYTIDMLMDLPPAALFIIAVLIGPFFEELIFRKLLLDRIGGYGTVLSMAISGLFFGLFHFNLFQFFYAAFIGMIFSYVYIRTGKLSYTYFMHMVFNTIGGFLPSFFADKLDSFTDLTAGFAEASDPAALEALGEELLSGGYLPLIIYYISVLTVAFIGLIIFVIFLIKRYFPKATIELGGGKAVKAALLNPGVIAYIILSIIITILNTFLTAA